MQKKCRPSFHEAFFFTGILLCILLVEACLLPSHPIWVTDNGNKLMVGEQIAETGSDFFPVKPVHGIKYEKENYPGVFHFHPMQKDGVEGYRSILPVSFPWLLGIAKRYFGLSAPLFFPILGTCLTFFLFQILLSTLRCSSRIRITLNLLWLVSAPYLFYSGTIWEMTLSCVFPMLSWLLWRNGRHFLAGLSLGMGLWLREECAVIAFLAGCSVLWVFRKEIPWRKLVSFSMGFLFPAGLLCLYNQINYDQILGLHGSLYYTHNTEHAIHRTAIQRLLHGYWMYLFRFEGRDAIPFSAENIPTIMLVAVCVSGAFRKREELKRIIMVPALCCYGMTYILTARHDALITDAGFNTGFIANSPLFLGFFLTWREQLESPRQSIRVLSWIALLYMLVMPPLLTQSDIGIIWGARHFLFLSPLYLLLSCHGFLHVYRMRRQALHAVIVILFAISSFWTMLSLYALHLQANQVQYATDFLESHVSPGTPIITDIFYLPELTPLTAKSRCFLYVKSDEALLRLVEKMKERKQNFALLLSTSEPYYGNITEKCLEQLNREEHLVAQGPYLMEKRGDTFVQFCIISASWR